MNTLRCCMLHAAPTKPASRAALAELARVEFGRGDVLDTGGEGIYPRMDQHALGAHLNNENRNTN